MRFSKIIFFSISLLSISNSFSEDAVFIGPIGDKWSYQTVVTIPAGEIELSADTFIKVDRLDLKGKVITNGYAFSIDAQEINIFPGSQIIGFKTPAGVLSDPDNRNAETVGGNGTYGIEGIPGTPGNTGMAGKLSPGAITIISGPVIGNLVIDGNGQKGGAGQKGGKGGKGSKGNNATPGTCKVPDCYFASSRYYDGTAGTNGGLGGIGGRGGEGGIGGAPISIVLATGSEQVSFSAKAGLGGDGGAPGDNGDSGSGGERANGIPYSRECGMWPGKYTRNCSGHDSPGGNKIERTETSASVEARTGKGGKTLLQSFNPPKITGTSSLIKKKSNILENAYIYHWERLYYYTMLQTLQYITNRELELNSLKDLQDEDYTSIFDDNNNDNEINIIKKKWDQYFVNKIAQNSNLNETTKKTYLDIANNFSNLLQSLSEAKREEVKNQIAKLKALSELMLRKALKKIAQSCQVFKNEQESILTENNLVLSDYFTIPLCSKEELKSLTLENFKHQLLLGIEPSSSIKGIDLKIEIGQKEIERIVSSTEIDVVLVNNIKYNAKDFQRAKDIDKSSLKEGYKIISLELESKKFQKADDIFTNLKRLTSGMKL